MMASDELGEELTEQQILNGWGNLGPVVVRLLRRVTVLEARLPPQTPPAPKCVGCKGPVEPARHEYVSPTCYRCLPPPEPLPVRAVAPQNLALPDYLLAPAPDYRSELPAEPETCGCDEAVALRATIARLSAELADAAKLYNGALDAQAEAEQNWFAARDETKQLRSDLQWETDQRRHEGREKLRERRERIAANTLLAEVRKHRVQEKREGHIQLELEDRIDAHLSGQPAAPGEPEWCAACMRARAECICPQSPELRCAPETRTAAEQRVLDACRDAVIIDEQRGTTVRLLSDGSSELVARAVLELREVNAEVTR